MWCWQLCQQLPRRSRSLAGRRARLLLCDFLEELQRGVGLLDDFLALPVKAIPHLPLDSHCGGYDRFLPSHSQTNHSAEFVSAIETRNHSWFLPMIILVNCVRPQVASRSQTMLFLSLRATTGRTVVNLAPPASGMPKLPIQ
jgi:hypothetical protein